MSSYLQPIADVVLPAVATILAAVLSALGAYALRWLRVRLDLDISRQTEADLRAIIEAAVYRAEQWARSRAPEIGERPRGAEKLGVAIRFVTDELARRGIEAPSVGALSDLIEARLGHPDAPGARRREAELQSYPPPSIPPPRGDDRPFSRLPPARKWEVVGSGGKPPRPPPVYGDDAVTDRPTDQTSGRYRDAGLPPERTR